MTESQKSSHAIERIALVFACLGWVTFGILAIPAVIIAHCLSSAGAAGSLTTKITFRVGYTVIAIVSVIALKMWLTVSTVYSNIEAARSGRFRGWRAFDEISSNSSQDASESTIFFQESHLSTWLLVVAIGLVMLLILPPVMTRVGRLREKAQAEKIMQGNRSR